MIQFELNGKEYKVIDNWSEVTLKQYLKFIKLEDEKNLFDLEVSLKMLEIMCNVEPGELNDMPLNELNDLVACLEFLKEKELPKYKEDNFNIEGVDYVIKTDMNSLSIGEVISIKQTQQSSTNPADWIPMVLAILIRPGIKKQIEAYDSIEQKMKKGTKWVQDRFVTDGLEDRINLFLDKLTVDKINGALNGFFPGSTQ